MKIIDKLELFVAANSYFRNNVFNKIDHYIFLDDSSIGPVETELSSQILSNNPANNYHSFVSPQVANTFCEVWAWGANDLGQLGSGNAVPT